VILIFGTLPAPPSTSTTTVTKHEKEETPCAGQF
jgi:hypothetical protein